MLMSGFLCFAKLDFFSYKIFFVQKIKWFAAMLLTLASIFYLSFFFIQTQIYIHAHTKYDNQSTFIKNMEV